MFHRGFGGAHSKKPFSKVVKINRNTQVGTRRHKSEGIQTRKHNQPLGLGDIGLRAADLRLPLVGRILRM